MDIDSLKNEWSNRNKCDIENAIPKNRYWWNCVKGHEWIASLGNRKYQNTGCPYCKSKLPSVDNNLKMKYPNISNEWDYVLNEKRPEDYLPSSNIRVNWVCKYGHKWMASINNRTRQNNNCPVCYKNESWCENYIYSIMSQVFDVIKHTNPEVDIYLKDLNIGIEYDGYYHKFRYDTDVIKNEWASKNLKLLIRIREKYLPDLPNITNVIIIKQKDSSKTSCIESITKISKILDMDISNIDFDISVSSKIRNLNISDDLMESWSKKNTIDISMAFKTHKYYWICNKCGSEYQTTYRERLKKECCPYCSSQKVNSTNSLSTTHPHLLKYLCANNTIDPTTVTFGTGKKLKFILNSSEYFTTPRNFSRFIKSFQ